MEKKISSVTAIVPIYNVERYLKECLDSIANQSVPFDEVVLVNDGSSDRSREISEAYCLYNKFKLINQKNQGLAAARNVGLKYASGDYVVFIDSDDYIDSDMNFYIQKNLREQDEKLDVLCYEARVKYDVEISGSKDAFCRDRNLNGVMMTGREYLYKAFPNNYAAPVWVAAYRRSFLEENKICFPEGMYFEDNYFSLQVMCRAKYLFCIGNVLYIRRCRENSITTGSIDQKKCMDLVMNQKLLYAYLKRNADAVEDGWFIRKFIAFNILETILSLKKCQDDTVTSEQIAQLSVMFLEEWFNSFKKEELKWGECIAVLAILDGLKMKDRQKYFADGKEYTKQSKKLREMAEQGIRKKLMKIPLRDGRKKIGIYGIGKHTMQLFWDYKKYVGEVNCDITFIVSELYGEKSFLGYPVFGCKDLPHDIDFYFISSRVYQREMKKKLRDHGIEDKKIITIYDNADICDIITAEMVLCNFRGER